MKELKGEPTQNCYTCQYRKSRGSKYTGVLIRNPESSGKCCRPEGVCERREMLEGAGRENAQENETILEAMEPATEAKNRPTVDTKQMNLF